jgi:hypothetical protein
MAAGLVAPKLAFADDPQRMPLSAAFKYLDKYLALPPGLRNHFYLVFRAVRNDRPAPDLKLAIVGQGAPQPVPLDAQAQVTHLPTLAQLQSNDALEIRGGGPFHFATEIRPDIAPSTHIQVAPIQTALSQVTAALDHMAGAFSAMVPKFTTVVFPDSGSGQALFAGNKVVNLPVTHQFKSMGPTPYLELDKMPGVQGVNLARAPSRLILAPTLKS